MGGWEAVVSESLPPPLFPSLFDPLLFSSPLATTPGSDANLPSPSSFLPPLLPFPFWEPLRILLSFLRRFLWRYTPALAGGRAGASFGSWENSIKF